MTAICVKLKAEGAANLVVPTRKNVRPQSGLQSPLPRVQLLVPPAQCFEAFAADFLLILVDGQRSERQVTAARTAQQFF